MDDQLAGLIARARAFDGHPPFSDGALAELATGAREVVWVDGIAAAVRTVAEALEATGSSFAEALEATGSSFAEALEATEASSAPATEAEFVVDPDARRLGHGRALLHRILVDAPGEVLLWAHGGHPAAQRLAASHGLEPVRELLRLRAGVGAVPFESLRDRGRFESLSDRGGLSERDVDALLAVNARAFAEHPEQGRLTRAEFDALAAEPWFDPEDVLLAWDGEQLAGFCWLKVEGGPSRASGTEPFAEALEATGEFYVVGVDPGHQGHGWGRRLVAAGMARLASRGIREAHLYVEADNAPALMLYREFGFRQDSIDIQYRWRSEPED